MTSNEGFTDVDTPVDKPDGGTGTPANTPGNNSHVARTPNGTVSNGHNTTSSNDVRSRGHYDMTVVHSPKSEDEEYTVDMRMDVPVDDIDRPISRVPNTFAAKKTVAQGMMDIALITANANQLRYIIEFTHGTNTYYLNLVLIVISLLLQVAVGISLIFKGKYDMKGMNKSPQAQRINNYVVVAVFMVTIINVFIASFTSTANSTAFAKVAPRIGSDDKEDVGALSN